MSSSSGNGPSTILVAPAPRADASLNDEEPQITVEKPQKAPKPPKEPFESRLDSWVIEQKPKDNDKFQLALWWLYTRAGLYKYESINPPLQVGWLQLGAEINRLTEVVKSFRHAAMAILTIITKKGGVGKTTVTTWLSAFIMNAFKLPVAIFDGDRGGGLVATRFGLEEEDALSIEELAGMVERGDPLEYEDLVNLTVTDPETGVMVFHAPPGRNIGFDKMLVTMQVLKKKFALMAIDTGPGFRVPVSNAAAQASNVSLVVGYGVSIESIEKGVKLTIDFDAYGLRERIEDVVVVIIGMPLRQCNARLAHNVAERCGVQPEQVAFIPYEKYMDDRIVKNLKRVRLSAVSKRTLLAFAELAEKVCVIAARINETKKQQLGQLLQQPDTSLIKPPPAS